MSAWDETRLETMRSMWLAGCSAGEIGAKLGVTRNVIIGRVTRMGLKRSDASKPKKVDHLIGRKGAAALAKARAASAAPKRPQDRSAHPWKPSVTRKPQPKGVMVLVPQKGSDPVANRIENMAARANPTEDVVIRSRAFAPMAGCEPVPFGRGGCRWPVGGEGADMLACGQRRADGEESYCRAHAKVSRPPPEAKKKLDRNLKIPTGRRAA